MSGHKVRMTVDKAGNLKKIELMQGDTIVQAECFSVQFRFARIEDGIESQIDTGVVDLSNIEIIGEE